MLAATQRSTAPNILTNLYYISAKLTAMGIQQTLGDVNSVKSHCIVESSKAFLIQSIDFDLALSAKL